MRQGAVEWEALPRSQEAGSGRLGSPGPEPGGRERQAGKPCPGAREQWSWEARMRGYLL
ncbi:MAG: hypothetical protein LBT40_09565 [Deltaproteobacteria bacterium]|nr:hypothetical protein [Deltaproteobacteria bacterium]